MRTEDDSYTTNWLIRWHRLSLKQISMPSSLPIIVSKGFSLIIYLPHEAHCKHFKWSGYQGRGHSHIWWSKWVGRDSFCVRPTKWNLLLSSLGAKIQKWAVQSKLMMTSRASDQVLRRQAQAAMEISYPRIAVKAEKKNWKSWKKCGGKEETGSVLKSSAVPSSGEIRFTGYGITLLSPQDWKTKGCCFEL